MRNRFDLARVREQLVNSGVVDTVQVRQQGFSYRRDKRGFLGTYISLLPELEDSVPLEGTDGEVNKAIDVLFTQVFDSMQNHVYTIGSSMIFVKKTDTITELNRKMRLQSADTALEEAIRGSEKSDIQYCQDL